MINKRFLILTATVSGLVVLAGCSWLKHSDQCEMCKPSAVSGATQVEAKPGAADWVISLKKGDKRIAAFTKEDFEHFVAELKQQQMMQLNQVPQAQLREYLTRMAGDLKGMCAALQDFYDKGLDKNPEFQRTLKTMIDNIVRGVAYRFWIEKTFKDNTLKDDEAAAIYQKEQTTMPELQRPPFVDIGVEALKVGVASEAEGKALVERAKKLGSLAKAAAEMKKSVQNIGFVSAQTYRKLGLDDMTASRILTMRTFPSVDVVKGGNGAFIVVEGTSQKKSAYKPFAEVKEQVKEAIAAHRVTKIIEDAIKAYDVEVNQAVIDETAKREGKPETAPTAAAK